MALPRLCQLVPADGQGAWQAQAPAEDAQYVAVQVHMHQAVVAAIGALSVALVNRNPSPDEPLPLTDDEADDLGRTVRP